MAKTVYTACRGRLALTSAPFAIALSCAFPAHAQEAGEIVGQAVPPAAAQADDDEAPAIVVTGLRASLEGAINTKRAATVIVDAINAEDIADFPDANLAESLQRLTGVSVDRDNGEGRTITVRGLGGDFNITRLNGLMALSTSGANDAGTSPNRSRSFDYNTFASELFNSLKVQKTASAATDEGALGANIDLQTARPFDFKEDRFAISSEGSYQKNSKAWSPRFAGLVSKKFMDGDMGLLVSFAYNKTRNELDSYQRGAGSSDYLYRSSDFAGDENPQRGGFSAPVGTNLGSGVTNASAIDVLTGSDPIAYAKLYPGAPFNTPGRFDDSIVRFPALSTIQQQDVKNQRLGLTAAYQWQIADRTRLNVDGLYSRFKNSSTKYQVGTVGLNRNNTNAAYNTAGNALTPSTARNLYPGVCTPRASSDITYGQDCGESLFGSTPAFGTALDANGSIVASQLGANIFSSNPNNLDPYDYYNNPNSVGYIPSANRLAYRGQLIGRPGVDVLDANVENGNANYLKLRNVDWRSAADRQDYTTKFYQWSVNLDHEFTDTLRGSFIYGQSKSTNNSQGLLVEFNRMDAPETFTYDEREGGAMPVFDAGFNLADPNNWTTVKGFSAIRNYVRTVENTQKSVKADFRWEASPELSVSFGGTWREFGFYTTQLERAVDTLNPTLQEAGTNAAALGRVVAFGQGLDVPAGTATQFYAPEIEKFADVYDFTCNCINKWGDWRIWSTRNNTATFGVDEKEYAFYLQGDWDVKLFDRPFRGNVGTRVAVTDLVSAGRTTAGRPIEGTNKYTDWLPSINLIYEPIDDVVIRLAAAKVMARPLLGNLSPTVSSITIPNTGDTTGGALTVGNPKLKPFYSTNLDFSAEWYFSKGGLLSVALFNKDIKSFPQTILFSGALSEFLDAEALTELRAQFTNANQIAYIDNDYEVTARQFRDAPGGYLRGIEVSFQQNFDFLPGFLKNFGGIINYTHIESKLTYILDPGNATKPQTLGKAPFLGVSPDALNATLFYETDRFRARVSMSKRKGYSTTYPLAAGDCAPGLTNSPASPSVAGTICNSPLVNDFQFSKGTTNVDASISYKVTDFASVTLEGLNLTDQTGNNYAYQDSPVVTNYSSSGPIYRVGLRAQF
jgi:TonB-dependent receptor